MDPTLSGFALGLLLAASKIGAIGTIGFGIAWWRTRSKLRRLEADPPRLEERLAHIEEIAEFTASQMDRLAETQDALARQLAPPPLHDDPPDHP